jgi:hypothetical protein
MSAKWIIVIMIVSNKFNTSKILWILMNSHDAIDVLK